MIRSLKNNLINSARIKVLRACLFAATCALAAGSALAATGLDVLPGKDGEVDGDGPVTVFYPSSAEVETVTRGPYNFQLAARGAPVYGNGRLIVLSHGSGGSPWTYKNLADALVEAGFMVAVPEHKGDNIQDMSLLGPRSWKRRPFEVSHAIDAIARSPGFAPLLDLKKVGMYGMSAGGHTALTLAGGRWSQTHLLAHCEAHIGDDFQACVGLTTSLTGGILDGVKKTIALAVIRTKLKESEWTAYTDRRIAAVVAGVPFAADFDPASLAAPQIPLGIITARLDRLLIPRYHSDAILQVCATCVRIADFPKGGHGALLSPLPPDMKGLLGQVMNDPPGFNRAETAVVDKKVVAFFKKHLLP